MKIDYSTDNPYLIDEPATDGDMFVGREQDIAWIAENLNNRSPRLPIIVHGPPGIGKTSILRQLEAGRLGPKTLTVYVDIEASPLDNLSGFLWQLTKATMVSLERQGVKSPRPEKRLFVIGPRRVFLQHLWRPLLEQINDRQLIFAFDNMDRLASRSATGSLESAILDYLGALFQFKGAFDYIFSLSSRIETFSAGDLEPFGLLRCRRLRSLSRDETLTLMRRPVPYRVFSEVASYVYDLVDGHPGDAQRICHALFNRCMERGFSQVTLSDVLAVLATDLKAADFRTPVYQRRHMISMHLEADAEVGAQRRGP